MCGVSAHEPWHGHDIVVEEDEQITCGGPRADQTRSRCPCASRFDGDDSGVEPGEAAQHVTRAVRAAVVHDDDFVVLWVTEKSLEQRGDLGDAVPCGDNDCDPRGLVGCVGSLDERHEVFLVA